MFGIENWASTRENLGGGGGGGEGGCEHQGADQPVHQQSDQHLKCYSLIGKYRIWTCFY